jgi:hypothetical protein
MSKIVRDKLKQCFWQTQKPRLNYKNNYVHLPMTKVCLLLDICILEVPQPMEITWAGNLNMIKVAIFIM